VSDIKKMLAADLRRDEGEVLHAYKDSLGFLTIGVGRLVDKRKGGCITEDESAYLLSNDINEVINSVTLALPWLAKHPDNVQRAIYNMAFQLGTKGLLAFKNTLALVEAGRYGEAADNALKSLWARQTPDRAKRVTDTLRGT
jgi:lysozyme